VNLQTQKASGTWVFDACVSTMRLPLGNWTQITLNIDSVSNTIIFWYGDGSNNHEWTCKFAADRSYVPIPASLVLSASLTNSKICLGQLNFYPSLLTKSQTKQCYNRSLTPSTFSVVIAKSPTYTPSYTPAPASVIYYLKT